MKKLVKICFLISVISSPVYLGACTTENRIEDRNDAANSSDRDLSGTRWDPDISTAPDKPGARK